MWIIQKIMMRISLACISNKLSIRTWQMRRIVCLRKAIMKKNKVKISNPETISSLQHKMQFKTVIGRS